MTNQQKRNENQDYRYSQKCILHAAVCSMYVVHVGKYVVCHHVAQMEIVHVTFACYSGT